MEVSRMAAKRILVRIVIFQGVEEHYDFTDEMIKERLSSVGIADFEENTSVIRNTLVGHNNLKGDPASTLVQIFCSNKEALKKIGKAFQDIQTHVDLILTEKSKPFWAGYYM